MNAGVYVVVSNNYERFEEYILVNLCASGLVPSFSHWVVLSRSSSWSRGEKWSRSWEGWEL